ncbi:hypothetical protein D3C83_289680 [compost metagenome]
MTDRAVAAAASEIEIVTGMLVEVGGPEIAADTPTPLKATDVTPLRSDPVIVAGNELP